MFKSRYFKPVAFTAGLFAVVLAFGANVFYAGYTPNTNQSGVNGLVVSGGPVPVVTGTCGTIPAALGGTTTGSVATAAVTTCTLIFTLPTNTQAVSGGAPGVNPPNGLWCQVYDVTHPAVEAIASVTANVCTTAAMTITAGDVIQYHIEGY